VVRVLDLLQLMAMSSNPYFKFLTVGTIRSYEMLNCAKFRQNRSNRGRNNGDFSMFFLNGGRRHLGFSKFQIFNGRNGQKGRSASPCQISSKSVQPRLKYGDFLIFQDGGRRHLGFSKFQIFNGGSGQEGRTTSPCQISLTSAKTRPRYRDLSIFQNGGRRHLGF